MRHNIRWFLPVIALAAVFALAAGASAQPATHTVKGVVKDKDGNIVAGAKVLLVKHDRAAKPAPANATSQPHPWAHRLREKLRASPRTTSDVNGQFSLTGDAGKYAVVAFKRGTGRGHVKVDLTTGDALDVVVTIVRHMHAATQK